MSENSNFSTGGAKLSSSSSMFCQAKGIFLAWLCYAHCHNRCLIRPFSLFIDEVLSENFLDYKNRGVNGSHRGQIIWKIDASSYFVERKYFSYPAMVYFSHWRKISELLKLFLGCFYAQ